MMCILMSSMYGLKLSLWTSLLLIALPFIPSVTQSTSISNDAMCAHHFNHKLLKCMRPFLDLYQSHQQAEKQGLRTDDLITKHLCFEYEKTLQCLHSALSSCPTLKNTQRVQHKLSAEWVTKVNQLCRIQSENSDEDNNETDDSDEMDYLVNTTDESESKLTNSEITETHLYEKNKHRSKSPRENFVGQKSNDPLWSRVIQVRQLKHSKRQESGSRSDNVEYKIYNIITNYSSSAIRWSSMSQWILTVICVLVL